MLFLTPENDFAGKEQVILLFQFILIFKFCGFAPWHIHMLIRI